MQHEARYFQSFLLKMKIFVAHIKRIGTKVLLHQPLTPIMKKDTSWEQQ